MVRALGRETWVEHGAHIELLEHVGGAADVVALRMGEDERCKAFDAESFELAGDVRLRRALVDEDGALRDLQQDRVALADVEHGDPQSVRERRGVPAAHSSRRRRGRP